MHLTSVHRYPVKSMRGEDLDVAAVEPWGLAGDRRWMLLDDDGVALTAREANRLLLVSPRLTEDGLRIEPPAGSTDVDDLVVEVPDPLDQRPVTLFSSRLTAAYAGAEAEAWFTDLLGRTARLVHLDDPTRRATDPAYSQDTDRVSLADGYPLLLTTRASLDALNDAVLERSEGLAEPLPMTRFRPNVVLDGATAWAEDDWRRVRIGGTTFRAVKGCARCVMTTVDPDTAERGKEPLRTLAGIRRWDGQTWFGVNLVPDVGTGADDPATEPLLRVGDGVEVLDAVEPGAGPLR